MSNEFWLQIMVYILSMGIVYGSFRTRLNYIEDKVDSYNEILERLIIVEQSTKVAHTRIDEYYSKDRNIHVNRGGKN